MARIVEPLNDTKIRASKPKAKEYKLFDGGGLYLSITPKGYKWWRIAQGYLNRLKKSRLRLPKSV